MKKLGLIGGMSWESTAEYYRIINQTVHNKLGGSHSSDCFIYSFNFEEIDRLQHEGQWEEMGVLLADRAVALEKAGAEIILLCTNTMHLLADTIMNRITIPFLHIVDVVGREIERKKLYKVGLLGTKFTMEKDFFKDRLSKMYGIEVITPTLEERDFIHHVIYHELVQGTISKESQEQFIAIADHLKNKGAEGVILGCTEIPLILKQDDCDIPLLDTTSLHATAGVRMALGEDME